MVCIKLSHTLIAVIVLIIVTTFFTGYYNRILESSTKISKLNQVNKDVKKDHCKEIQIGLVCVTQASKINLYTMLKSLLSFRSNPIHFHIVVNPLSKHSLEKLFDSWALPQVKISFYNLKDVDPNNDFTDSPNLLRVVLPKLIKFEEISKIILLNTDIVFNKDIYELWDQFQYFHKSQVLGISLEKGKDERANADVVLYHLINLRNYGLDKIWEMVKDRHFFKYDEFAQIQLIANFFKTSKLEHTLPCDWNSRSTDCAMEYKVVHQSLKGEISKRLVSKYMSSDGNAVREHNSNCDIVPQQVVRFKRPITDKCFYFPESDVCQRRTLLYFYKYMYVPSKSDVTLVTQLSFDKLDLIEELAKRWKGPMSISFYLTDSEYVKCREHIKNSEILKDRLNIGYHAVFKFGYYYHINYLRNIALSEVNTPYLFSDDIDLLPMENLYSVLKMYLGSFPDMTKKALVVPAFETKKLEVKVPSTMKELFEMLKRREVFIFQEDTRPEGHGPTHYIKWKTATEPYKVTWKNKYEPYIVVKKDVVKYDERFFTYGWDKISHIMEIEAQGYEFYVLPNTFIVHKFHQKSWDKVNFLTSKRYQMCLKTIKEQSAKDLKRKYGRTFLIDELEDDLPLMKIKTETNRI